MSNPIPTAALDDRLFFGGVAGSGKTYAAGTAVERLLSTGARVVIPDPLGVWWGLALEKDGKTPSAFRQKEKLVIFGGPRGDLGLTEHSGALIGETVAGMAESCILDLSELKTGAAERRFMLAFLTALYASKTREPLHIVFDEADLWAPQRVTDKEGEAMKLLGMMENICRRGRVKGFIPWLISQRPAVVTKNVLSQINGMIVFKLTSVQDRDAIGDWVQGQADKAEWSKIWSNMPTLERGQGLVWLPARGILKTAPFPTKETFDSSRTPKRGERVASARMLQPVNIESLKEKLATVEAETKANDPRALKAENAKLKSEKATLERQMAEAVKSKVVADPNAIREAEKRGFDQAKKTFAPSAQRALNKATAGMMRAVQARLRDLETDVHHDFKAMRETIPGLDAELTFEPSAPAVAPKKPFTVAKADQHLRLAPAAPAQVNGDGTYTRPQMRVLRSLAMWKSLGHESPSREMVAAVAGYSPSSGGFNNLLGSLGPKAINAIGIPQPGAVCLQTNGIEVPTVDEGRQLLLSVLSNPQRKLVDALNGSGAITRDALGEATGYSASSGGFNNLIGSLNSLGISYVPTSGHVSLSDWAQELLGN